MVIPRPAYLTAIGTLLGVGIAICLISINSIRTTAICQQQQISTAESLDKNLVLVGIMTAAKFVDTRAYNVWKTWGQHFPGKVLFFVSENTETIHPDLPIVRLKGVDDTYPPQKKSFAMVKWMAENYINNFDWFLRADDDLYIRGDKLAEMLRSLDSSKAYMLGQAGLGNSAEYGLLSLAPDENYCMGGPGVLLSREALRLVSPHLEDCLHHLLTTHEDVELGRCITKYAKVNCPWSYEMRKFFHNSGNAIKAYTGELSEVKSAVTVHPVKNPAVMQRVHAHNRAFKLTELRSERALLKNELSYSKPSLLTRTTSNKTSEIGIWNYLNIDKIMFCVDQLKCPRRSVEQSIKSEIFDVISKVFEEYNVDSRQHRRLLQFRKLQYGYMRVNPSHGVDYILDMSLWYKKVHSTRNIARSVRRHEYIQQIFDPIQAISDEKIRENLRIHSRFTTENNHIHIILPLKGRSIIFSRFAKYLINLKPLTEEISLIIVLYSSEDLDNNWDTIDELKRNHISVSTIDLGDAAFSRGIALTKGSELVPKDGLMFFMDVDMVFTNNLFQRIRLNTILNAQVYFPIVFSEFLPDNWSEDDKTKSTPFNYGNRRGQFRYFGYGLVSIYKADFDATGGFDTSIEGWGKEDLDFFERVVNTGKLRVIRAPEPELVHIYHNSSCSLTLSDEQLQMCYGSKYSNLASLDTLVDQVLQYT